MNTPNSKIHVLVLSNINNLEDNLKEIGLNISLEKSTKVNASISPLGIRLFRFLNRFTDNKHLRGPFPFWFYRKYRKFLEKNFVSSKRVDAKLALQKALRSSEFIIVEEFQKEYNQLIGNE